MAELLNRVGEESKTNQGYTAKIIEYFNARNSTIIFNDGTIVKKIFYSAFISGKISNPNYKSLCGIGFIGQGKFKFSEGAFIWKNMFNRCYSEKYLYKYPTYKDCTVDERWYNYQNFAKWYEENYNIDTMQGWHLDKDILVKGNKVYSPDTCCFVPTRINTLIIKCNSRRGEFPIGVTKLKNGFKSQCRINGKNWSSKKCSTPEEAFQAYKTAKEKYIKEVAGKWRGKISEKVYQALINYKVILTD